MNKIWHWYTVVLLLSSAQLNSQASFTVMGTPYTQNFNTLSAGADGATYAWTDNTTLTGWYIDEAAGAADNLPLIEASYTTMQNGGSAYIYRNAGDCSLGSRAAGSTNTCYYGIRIVNSTGSAISSIYFDYYGEQWTIAENQTNVNTIALDYQVGATVTSLTAGVWTNAPTLGFTQIYTSAQSSGMGGSACGGSSAQCLALNGNLSANRRRIQGCITVAIPAGQEIMFRWVDIDNAANDHHMQIDDLSIWPFDIACATILPVELLNFTAEKEGNVSQLKWETASEENNNYFNVERLNANGEFEVIGQVAGHGSTSMYSYYAFVDESPLSGVNYYRLAQVDYNGNLSHSEIRAVTFDEERSFSTQVNYAFAQLEYSQSGANGPTQISVFSSDGKLVSETKSESPKGELPCPETDGIYFVVFTNAEGSSTHKLIIVH